MFGNHITRLYVATIGCSFGSGFLIYSTYVTNNLQIVGEQWLNSTHAALHGVEASEQSVAYLWACVIASKEVGKMLGSLLLPYFAERLGRRGGMLAMCLITFVGCLLCIFGYYTTYHVIMLGRVLLGISMICGVGLCSMFLIEVAPLKTRGASGALIQIFRGLGGTMGMVLALPELMGTSSLWTLCLGVPLLPAVVQFVILLCSMESPRHLFITQNDVGRAAVAVRFYQGRHNVAGALNELSKEKARIDELRQKDASVGGCLSAAHFWRPMLLTTLALTNRSLAGILPVQSYSTNMFISTGMDRHAAGYSTVVLGVCHLVSAVTVTFTVERCNRRPLLICGNVGCLLTMLLVSFFAAMSHVYWAKYAAVVSLGVFMLIYPVVASVSNIVASEICHQRIRSYAFTIGLFSYSIVGFVSTFTYPILKRTVGLPSSFAPFCVCLVLTVVVYAVWLPETRGKTFEAVAFDESAEILADTVALTNGNHHKKNGLIPMRNSGRAADSQPLLLESDDDEC